MSPNGCSSRVGRGAIGYQDPAVSRGAGLSSCARVGRFKWIGGEMTPTTRSRVRRDQAVVPFTKTRNGLQTLHFGRRGCSVETPTVCVPRHHHRHALRNGRCVQIRTAVTRRSCGVSPGQPALRHLGVDRRHRNTANGPQLPLPIEGGIGPQPHPSFIEVFGEAALDDRHGPMEGAGEDPPITIIRAQAWRRNRSPPTL